MHALSLWMAQQPPAALVWYGAVLGLVLGELIRAVRDIVVYVYRRLTNRCVCCGTPLETSELDA